MRTDTSQTLSTIIGQIYDAALDHSRWVDVLASVSDLIGGSGAVIVVQDPRTSRVRWTTQARMDPDVIDKYVQYYSAIELRFPAIVSVPTGTVQTEYSLIDKDTYLKSEIYNDFLIPCDIPHICAAVLEKEPDATFISIEGSRRRGRFETQERELLQALVPHLKRAVHIGKLLNSHQQRLDSFHELLNNLTLGIIALDGEGRIRETNRIASTCLAKRDAIACHHGTLVALSALAQSCLQRAIAHACRGEAPGGDLEGINLPRAGGGRGYTAIVEPASRALTMQDTAGIAAFVFLIDHDAAPLAIAPLLQQRFGLTVAEANVALGVLEGLSLKEISSCRGTSLETTRSQMKRVLSKCQARNQAGLMRMLTQISIVSNGNSSSLNR